ncbi:hypothetical protein FOZ63_029163 [Perkinsus olseni]|uniref:BART domain-containing protein n=1 Tax=Perkinsus olseni TaxID=32597 RepID=A0A7J6QII6_PEROL|nr:hypothetical protein FOZ63_029163 [Perkinsus olseni]
MSTEVVPDSITAAEPPSEDAAEEAETQRVLEFFAALELECTSGKFTDAVSKFIFDHADTFDDRDLDQDIPLDWHNIFLAYRSLIEDEIKNVLDAHRVSDEEFATYLEVIAEKGGPCGQGQCAHPPFHKLPSFESTLCDTPTPDTARVIVSACI